MAEDTLGHCFQDNIQALVAASVGVAGTEDRCFLLSKIDYVYWFGNVETELNENLACCCVCEYPALREI